MADWLGISTTLDLENLPAVAEQLIGEGIEERDPYFVGDRGKQGH